jgi:hypothetical protein
VGGAESVHRIVTSGRRTAGNRDMVVPPDGVLQRRRPEAAPNGAAVVRAARCEAAGAGSRTTVAGRGDQ